MEFLTKGEIFIRIFPKHVHRAFLLLNVKRLKYNQRVSYLYESEILINACEIRIEKLVTKGSSPVGGGVITSPLLGGDEVSPFPLIKGV